MVTGLRLPPMAWAVVIGFAALTAGHTLILGRLLSAMDPDVGVRKALRRFDRGTPAGTAGIVRPLTGPPLRVISR